MICVNCHRGKVEWDVDLILDAIFRRRNDSLCQLNRRFPKVRIPELSEIIAFFDKNGESGECIKLCRDRLTREIITLYAAYQELFKRTCAMVDRKWAEHKLQIERELMCFFGIEQTLTTTAYAIAFPTCPCIPTTEEFAVSVSQPEKNLIKTVIHELIHIYYYHTLRVGKIALRENQLFSPSSDWVVSEAIAQIVMRRQAVRAIIGGTVRSRYFNDEAMKDILTVYSKKMECWDFLELREVLLKVATKKK